MPIFEPLAILAAIFALISAGAWAQVVKAAFRHGESVGRVSEKLITAAAGTMLTFATAAASVLALPVAGLFVG